MYQAFKKYFLLFLNINEFARGGITLAALALVFFIWHIYLSGSQTNSPNKILTTTTITLDHIDSGNQRGFSFLGRERPDSKRLKYIVIPSYTETTKSIKSSTGKQITVNHYDGIVSSCFINEVQMCIPKCVTSHECERKLLTGDLAVIKWMSFTFLFLSTICFVSYYIRFRGNPN